MNELIHEELLKLQNELLTLDSAVKHITKASDISNITVESVKDLKTKIETSVEGLITSYKNEVNEIAIGLKKLQSEAENLFITNDELNKNFDKYLKSINEINFPERLDSIYQKTSSIQNLVDSIYNNINTTNENLLKQFTDIKTHLYEKIEIIKGSLSILDSTIQNQHFPERMDKLDSSVAGIVLSIQNIQLRVESLEGNIKSEIERVKNDLYIKLDKSEQRIIAIEDKVERELPEIKKSILTNRYISITSILLIIILIIFQLLKL